MSLFDTYVNCIKGEKVIATRSPQVTNREASLKKGFLSSDKNMVSKWVNLGLLPTYRAYSEFCYLLVA